MEELNIIEDGLSSHAQRPIRDMDKYAPLIFEECFVQTDGQSRMANAFELE